MKIGFIGAGKHAQTIHIPNFQAQPDCQIACLMDADGELAAKVARRFDIPKVYTSHTEMLRNEKLDAVMVVLNPIPFMESLICDLLAAGMPTITEKPLAGSVPAGERIVAQWKKTGTPLHVGYNKRCDPATLWAKAEIAKVMKTGELGAMRYVRMHVSLSGNWTTGVYRSAIQGTAVPTPTPRPVDEFAGMNETARKKFFDFIMARSHQLDFIRHLLAVPYHIKYTDPTATILAVESELGVPAVYECTPFNSKQDWREHAAVFFDKGYIKIYHPAPLALNRSGTAEYFRDTDTDPLPVTTIPVFPAKSSMFSLAETCMAALKGESTPLCTPAEALETLTIARDWVTRLYQ